MSVTGYGPAPSQKHLYFDGDEEKFDLWEIKFLAHLRLRKLSLDDDTEAEKNADVFAELVQVLDDKSLQLVMRDAVNDGREAVKILREHYRGKTKPRIISLYTELTSLRMKDSESVTDYILRAESSATSLKSAGETISDSLLIAMVLKGLPEQFTAFSTVVMQKDKEPKFTEFKSLLRSYEESQRSRASHVEKSENILKVTSKEGHEDKYKSVDRPISQVTCYTCGRIGHRSYECTAKIRKNRGKWCKECRSSTHNFTECRVHSAAKLCRPKPASERDEDFCFKMSCPLYNDLDECNILVGCVAIELMIKPNSRVFIKF